MMLGDVISDVTETLRVPRGGEINTPSPGTTEWIAKDLAQGTVAVSARHSK